MYQSSADFGGSFRLKRKSRKTFDFIVSTKYVFFYNFALWGGEGAGEAAGLQSPLPLE